MTRDNANGRARAFAVLKRAISAETGLRFPDESQSSFEQKISEACADFGFRESAECLRWLTARSLSKKDIEILASHLTVGETYFFRDPKSLEVMQRRILPALIERRRNVSKSLRFWSAGCCTGEEPYTLAMLVMTMMPDWESWNITILATDINTRFLSKAAQGRYSEWSFRETPEVMRRRFFKKIDAATYEIDPRVRNLVSFSYLNLAEDLYPSVLNNTHAMDLILCRNVLMYFEKPRAGQVIEKLHRSLVDGGYLMVSAVEASNRSFEQFQPVVFDGLTVYRRTIPPLSAPAALPRKGDALTPSGTPDTALLRKKKAATPKRAEQTRKPLESKPTVRQRRGSYRHAELLYKQGAFQGAIEELLKCDHTPKTLALLTKAYADTGNFDSALHWCNELVAADKLEAKHYFLLATILQEKNSPAEALEALRRALFLDPSFILAHVSTANALRGVGRRKEARKHFDNALALLEKLPYDVEVAESGGLPAGRLREMIQLIDQREYEDE